MKKKFGVVILVLLVIGILASGGKDGGARGVSEEKNAVQVSEESSTAAASKESEETVSPERDRAETGESLENSAAPEKEEAAESGRRPELKAPNLCLSDIPAYAEESFVAVNGNIPFFSEEELAMAVSSFEEYSPLDEKGRCGPCWASVGRDIMPTEPRGEIGQVKPAGWQTVKYNDLIEGNYLYNRCHLIAYRLTGENANINNLITGTRHLNTQGMEPYETMVADYVEKTGNHVLYRVTPLYEGENLLAGGVLMEAESVEDGGEGIRFCVFCYNVQPGIWIDYANGDSRRADDGTASESVVSVATMEDQLTDEEPAVSENKVTYILNTNTHKFHYPNCKSVSQMKEKNKKEFTGTREEAIAMGYVPCKNCRP